MSSLNKTSFFPKSTTLNSWICTRAGGLDPSCGLSLNTCATGFTLSQNTSGTLSHHLESRISNLKAVTCRTHFTSSPWLTSTNATSGNNNSCSLNGSFYCVERVPLLEPFYQWRFENNYLSSTVNTKTGTQNKFGGGAYNLASSVDFGATNLGSQFSFTLWVRVDNVSASYDEKLYTILSNQVNTNGEALGFSLTVNKWNLENRVLQAQFGSGLVKRTVESNPNTIDYDTWIHIALTVDYTTGIAKLYKNGLPLPLATSASLPVVVPGSQNFRLGTLANFFNYRGFMDDVHYYNKTLTDAEVLSIYNS